MLLNKPILQTTFLGIVFGMIIFGFALQIDKTLAALPTTPVPSYDSVVVDEKQTTINISDAQIKEWSGSYQLWDKNLLLHVSDVKEVIYSSLGLELKPSINKTSFNPKKIYQWSGKIASDINSKAINPEMTIINGRVTKFVPPQPGRTIDRYKSTLKIIESLEKGNKTVSLTVSTTQPEKQLSDLNNLGIKEIIGRGESKFAGSPANRIHNIKVGIQKMSGIIVKPGEEFSFNNYLGPVEAYAGFLPELVIKGNETIPELGGGLCQVSSTAFRGIMNAGLPVTQRKNHSYAVQYYAPQGTDATIYPGVIDLKFVNDTGNSILVWPYFKSATHIVFDFYGTNDNREVVLEQPYIYDKKADGSMKATWKRTVVKNGKRSDDVFSSIYKPPALFKRQETFVASDGTTNQNTSSPNTNTPTQPTNTTPTPVQVIDSDEEVSNSDNENI